jgi:hypothetical protein
MEEGAGMRAFIAIAIIIAAIAGAVWLYQHPWDVPFVQTPGEHHDRGGSGRWSASDWTVEGRWDAYGSHYSLTASAPPADLHGPDLFLRCRDGHFDLSLIGDSDSQYVEGLYDIDVSTDKSYGSVLALTRDDPIWADDVTVPADTAEFALADAKQIVVTVGYRQGGFRTYTYNFKNLAAGKPQLYRVCNGYPQPYYGNNSYPTTPYTGSGGGYQEGGTYPSSQPYSNSYATTPSNGGYSSGGDNYSSDNGYNNRQSGGGYDNYRSGGAPYATIDGYNDHARSGEGYNDRARDGGGYNDHARDGGYNDYRRPWHPKPRPPEKPPGPINPPRYRSLTQEQDISSQHKKALKDGKGEIAH